MGGSVFEIFFEDKIDTEFHTFSKLALKDKNFNKKTIYKLTLKDGSTREVEATMADAAIRSIDPQLGNCIRATLKSKDILQE